MERVRVFISGTVQGVSFRYYTRKKATELSLTGFVKNLSDGSVEAVFEGESTIVQQMIQWCHSGSPLARVDRVEINLEPATGEFERFSIAR